MQSITRHQKRVALTRCCCCCFVVTHRLNHPAIKHLILASWSPCHAARSADITASNLSARVHMMNRDEDPPRLSYLTPLLSPHSQMSLNLLTAWYKFSLQLRIMHNTATEMVNKSVRLGTKRDTDLSRFCCESRVNSTGILTCFFIHIIDAYQIFSQNYKIHYYYNLCSEIKKNIHFCFLA